MVHDATLEDPSYAFALSRLSSQNLAHTVTGVFRSVSRPVYDDQVRAQIEQAKAPSPADLQSLLAGKDTWDCRRLTPRLLSPPHPAPYGFGAPPVTTAPTHEHAALATDTVRKALSAVLDPEIQRPITDLGMVKEISVGADGAVLVGIYLTVAGCPLREKITADATAAVSALPGVCEVRVELDVMSDEQRTELRRSLRGDTDEPVIPFARPGSLTRVYCVASGKGGVGNQCHGQPCRRDGLPRTVGRRAGRRHLRPDRCRADAGE